MEHILGLTLDDSIGKKYISEINDYGNKARDNIFKISIEKPNVVVYLDSCRHHTYSRGQHMTLVRDDAMISPANILQEWIKKYFTKHQNQIIVVSESEFTWKSLFEQNKPYPCVHCCRGFPPLE